MSFLQTLTPINLLEEKAKFLADNSYNPQFIYETQIDQNKLNQYGQPQPKYLELAQEILDQAYFGRNEADLFMTEGKQLSQIEVDKRVRSFLAMHQLSKRYEVIWSESFISRTSITKNKIKLRLPSDYRQEGLIGMLYHEIGTHALRRINYEAQPFYMQKQKYGFIDYLKNEECLASLHALLPHSFKLAFGQAIRYLAVDYAQTHSFSQLWQFLGKYIQDENRRFVVTFRQKRGVKNTSQGGGYSKDLVYFEGLIEVWQWLKVHSFNLSQLYYGKIAANDTEKARTMSPDYHPKLPSFFLLDPDKYGRIMQEIGKENFLDNI